MGRRDRLRRLFSVRAARFLAREMWVFWCRLSGLTMAMFWLVVIWWWVVA